MEYSINKFAKLAGVSTRTLRYYDEIGLLSPNRTSSNGYRVYGKKEVDLLQQIMFYRELGVSLEKIKSILSSEEYNALEALQGHLMDLNAKKEQFEILIGNVEKTIAESRGEITMSDGEKFEGFKKKILQENEKEYGEEIRERFGDDTVKRSNMKFMNSTRKDLEKTEELSSRFNEALKEAFIDGDPSSEVAQEACELHREWLGSYWDEYSKEAHLGLAKMYVDDSRFKKYYDNIVDGGAEFLYEAMKIYCK